MSDAKRTQSPKSQPDIDVEPIRALLKERDTCLENIKDFKKLAADLKNEVDSFMEAEGPIDDVSTSPIAAKVIQQQCIPPRIKKNQKRVDELDAMIEAALPALVTACSEECSREADAIKAKVLAFLEPYSDVHMVQSKRFVGRMEAVTLLAFRVDGIMGTMMDAAWKAEQLVAVVDEAKADGSFWNAIRKARLDIAAEDERSREKDMNEQQARFRDEAEKEAEARRKAKAK